MCEDTYVTQEVAEEVHEHMYMYTSTCWDAKWLVDRHYERTPNHAALPNKMTPCVHGGLSDCLIYSVLLTAFTTKDTPFGSACGTISSIASTLTHTHTWMNVHGVYRPTRHA